MPTDESRAEAQPPTFVSPLAKEIGLIESLSKLLAATLAILYILGFLVVATFLSKFGVSSFSVLQLQYLLAGIWVLGPFVLYSAVVYLGRNFEVASAPSIDGKTNWPRFLLTAIFTSIPVNILLILMFAIPNVWESLTWKIGRGFLSFYIGIVICTTLLVMSRKVVREKESWLIKPSHTGFYSITLFMLVLAYTVWFSVRIFPLIPASLGGGRPLSVVFFEGEKKMPDEIQRDGATKRSIQYKLILSTDKYYVVLSPSSRERSMEISRDSVAGMIVLNEGVR